MGIGVFVVLLDVDVCVCQHGTCVGHTQAGAHPSAVRSGINASNNLLAVLHTDQQHPLRRWRAKLADRPLGRPPG